MITRQASSPPLTVNKVTSVGSRRARIGAPSASASQSCDHSNAPPYAARSSSAASGPRRSPTRTPPPQRPPPQPSRSPSGQRDSAKPAGLLADSGTTALKQQDWLE